MQYLQFTSWLEEGYVISRNKPRPNKYTVHGASASLELRDRPSVLHVPTEHGVCAPRLCFCFNGLGVHVPPGHVRHCARQRRRSEHILTSLGDEAALVVVALVVEGRLYRAGPCEFLHALDEPHRCRVGRMTPVELLAPGQRLPPTGSWPRGGGRRK
jgi:hypothetical protein